MSFMTVFHRPEETRDTLSAKLRRDTEVFCASETLLDQTRCFTELFSSIWRSPSDQASNTNLKCWLGLLEGDSDLRLRFQLKWKTMLGSFDSVFLFAETGLPAHHALFQEITRRLLQRVLPSPRRDDDTVRLFAAVFYSPRTVGRFLDIDAACFARLSAILWSADGFVSFPRLREDLNQALRLLAARVSGRGTGVAIHQRSETYRVEQSPFYDFVFATERFIECADSEPAEVCLEKWLEAVYACRGALALVRLNMEDSGVNTPLVFDLSAIDASLDRMEMLAQIMAEPEGQLQNTARRLVNTLACGLLEDVRVSTLLRQNFNLLARKTVERTGHGGEHYIAHSRKEYWHMWGMAIGGGFLTVFTAAIKLHVIRQQWPPFIEAMLVGTNYAISFVLLLIFGLALATKQPAMTGATLADIIRRNRGDFRRDKITEFAASISRTQIAAALGNIVAVCSGAFIFDQIWRAAFHTPYVQVDQAEHVYQSLRPLASGTAVDAALTGVLLWLAGLIGGWCENFAVYNRIPVSIAQHPLGRRIGVQRMEKIADWFGRNIAPWSTSIALGYLLGFTPAIAQFFGLPLDVRHVTLNTGMFAFAAAGLGPAALTRVMLYTAAGGIAMMFVLNLGVSFCIASFVALRAYDVRRAERKTILRYAIRRFIKSPLPFLFPIEWDAPAPPPPGEATEPAMSLIKDSMRVNGA